MDSASHCLTSRIGLAADAGYGLVRSTAVFRQQLERLLFRRYPDAEWGTFFRFGYRPTRWGLMVCLIDLIPPQRGDFDEQSALVEFAPSYIGRALDDFENHSLGIGFIHSHPEDCQPGPSRSDDDMDSYFAREFEKYSNGRPYVSLILSRKQSGQRSFSGRIFHSGKWLAAEQWMTAGTEELRREYDFRRRPPLSADASTTERLSQLIGRSASQRLANAKVGIVGCSGLGTPVAHVLCRAGVGSFVLVDPGYFKASNLERNHASRSDDLYAAPKSKVELLKRMMHEIRPSTEVITFQTDVLADEVVDELSRCDIVLGCTDSEYARAALGDLATHYLLPVLDLAVQMAAKDESLISQVGEIARYLAGLPCPWCRNRVSAKGIRAELATPNEREKSAQAAREAQAVGMDGAPYWIGSKPLELTVGYMTTAVAALGAGYAQHWLTGCAKMPHNRMQFDFGSPFLGVVEDERASQPDCSCAKYQGYADQGRAYFSVSMPSDT